MINPRLALLSLLLGLALGALVAAFPEPVLIGAVEWIEPIGTMWINALRMVVVPLVVALLVVGVASIADLRVVGQLGGRAVLVFVLLLGVSSAIGVTLVPALFSGLSIDPATTVTLRESAASTAEATSAGLRQMPPFRQWLVELVPVNPIRSAADGAMLPLVVFSVVLGLAATRVRREDADVLVGFFRAVSEAMLVVVRWVLGLAPIGIFALSLGIASRMGVAAAGAIGYYIGVVAISLTVLIVAHYAVVAIAGGISLPRFSRAALPAQIVGFTSRSSLASLPAQVHAANRQLDLPTPISGFVLPLAVATFKPHAPANWCALAVFTGLLYGVPLGTMELVTVAISALALSFAVPGIPSAGMLLAAPIFVSVGLPVEALGILIAVDHIPDMFKTTANVTGQFTSGVLVARFVGESSPAAAPQAPLEVPAAG